MTYRRPGRPRKEEIEARAPAVPLVPVKVPVHIEDQPGCICPCCSHKIIPLRIYTQSTHRTFRCPDCLGLFQVSRTLPHMVRVL